MSRVLPENPFPTPPHKGEGLNLSTRPTTKSLPGTLRSKEGSAVPRVSPSHLWGGVGEGSFPGMRRLS
ncbi:UNVERIFIED_ORG: cobaltochelatase CobN [Rhizobium aethiopicum]